MALDGITLYAELSELRGRLIGSRIDKIYQPLRDEITLGLRGNGENLKLLLSANPSHPRIHITEKTRENPLTAPMFTMILRKHIAGGRIAGIIQPDFERIVFLDIEAMNEMGDLVNRRLVLEIMGKHSNIILCDENGKILDAIKRISHDKSSVREVLPGLSYELPPGGKLNPLNIIAADEEKRELAKDAFVSLFQEKDTIKLQNLIYQGYTGISPIMASEICIRAGLNPSDFAEQISAEKQTELFLAFERSLRELSKNELFPAVYYENGSVRDFFVLKSYLLSELKKKECGSVSELLELFYGERDLRDNLKQRTQDLRKLITTYIERTVKKRELQLKTLKDISGREAWKRKGELITAYIYDIKKGMTKYTAYNFYEEGSPAIEISLDATKTPAENAQRYFNKYNKAKRTQAALDIQLRESAELLDYLKNVLNSIETAENDRDIKELRQELKDEGILKRVKEGRQKQQKTKRAEPMRFVSEEGFEVYVGKTGRQNDELTMKRARPNDIWLHTKEIPGSHVIIVTDGKEVPAETILFAARLAAAYSSARNGSNVPVDYAEKRYVKKPSGARPGLVIYTNNNTVYVTPNKA